MFYTIARNSESTWIVQYQDFQEPLLQGNLPRRQYQKGHAQNRQDRNHLRLPDFVLGPGRPARVVSREACF